MSILSGMTIETCLVCLFRNKRILTF